MLVKNLHVAKAIQTIIIRMVLDAIAAWKGLLNGNTGFFMAIFKAHVFFFKWLFFYHNKSVYTTPRKGQLNGWYPSSVVWQHFVKKKNTFSEIVKNK